MPKGQHKTNKSSLVTCLMTTHLGNLALDQDANGQKTIYIKERKKVNLKTLKRVTDILIVMLSEILTSSMFYIWLTFPLIYDFGHTDSKES